MRDKGVTTLVRIGCYNCPTEWVPTANALQWYPEWYLSSSIPDAEGGRVFPQLEWANAFMTSYQRRHGARPSQLWYRAYREGCPQCPEPEAPQAPLFDRLTLLFSGIQAAGPRLSPESVDRGLPALAQRPSADPYTPAAYFAPGNYSFVKDAMVAWWDPAATASDGQPGCWRVAEDGLRRRQADWRRGPFVIKDSERQCQGA